MLEGGTTVCDSLPLDEDGVASFEEVERRIFGLLVSLTGEDTPLLLPVLVRDLFPFDISSTLLPTELAILLTLVDDGVLLELYTH